jgi:two-component system cell cycle sensor histidine kinase/response regulator CckA
MLTSLTIGLLVLASGAAFIYAAQQQRRCAREAAATNALRDHCAELERRNQRHQTILEHAMDGFFVLDEQGRFINVNPAFGRMLGYTSEELLSMKISDVESESGAGFGPAALRTGLHHFPSVHRHRDGRPVHLESSIVVVRDGDRKILVGFARDITERMRAEEALRRSEEQYRTIVETSRDLIWSLDGEGRWRFLNSAARSLFGYEPEELFGRPFAQMLAEESRAQFADEWRATLQSDQSHWLFECTQLHKDGRRVYLVFNAIVRRDTLGRVVEVTGTARDMTRRREVEAELREAHARFEALKSGIPLGYIVWTLDGRIVEWNASAAAMFDLAHEEAIGYDATRLVAPEQVARFKAMRDELGRGQRQCTAMLLNRRKDGTTMRCEWFSTVLRDAQGQPHLVASIVRDVSERERLEAQLWHAKKMESIGVLAGGVAHDFNNLLVSILGNATLAQQETPPNSPARAYLLNVTKAAARGGELTRQILTIAGRAPAVIQPLDLNALIGEMTEFMAAAIPRNVRLEIDLAPELSPIAADSSQIQQVVMNLVINASEACGEQGGTVCIRTRRQTLDERARAIFRFGEQDLPAGEYVCVEVSDTGCGMTPETLARIFDPFFSTKFAGRGLGLAAIRGIVKAHQGGIHVETEPGRGTTFAIVLPLTSAPAVASSDTNGDKKYEIPAGSTILVIDDEEGVREVVQAVLEKHGARVLVAEDGLRGLSVFKEKSSEIDAVLLDLTMPGMGGEAVYRELARLRPNVRVIISSGYSEQETTARFCDGRLAGFVHKPYSADTLINKLGAALVAE